MKLRGKLYHASSPGASIERGGSKARVHGVLIVRGVTHRVKHEESGLLPHTFAYTC